MLNQLSHPGALQYVNLKILSNITHEEIELHDIK